MANSFQSYALALLTLVRNLEDVDENPPFGIAIRRDTDTPSFNMPAHNFLRFLVEHSPSPETIARLFITELARCEIPALKNLVNSLNSSDRSVSPGDWAMAVQEEIRQRSGNMTPLTDLASFSLTCLVVGFRKRSVRNSTPQDSLSRTPSRTFFELLSEARTAHRRQAALQEPIIRRDGPRCLVTGYTFVGRGRVQCNCAHIIPVSVHDKPILHYAIEMFTGHQLSTENIQHLINHPANIINLQSDASESMVRELAWGIEARSVNNEWKYYFRVVKPDYIYGTIRLNDGDEIQFGRGSHGDTIALPDPRACNLHLAICRVFAALGAAEVVDKYLEDLSDDQPAVPVLRSSTRPSYYRRYLGGQFVSDEVLRVVDQRY